MNEQHRVWLKRRAARWSLFSNSGLLVLKAVVGLVTGSVGILAEVVNSAADLFGAAVAYFSVRVSDEPPDRSHAYGHGKIENLSGALTAALVICGGAYAINEAVRHLVQGARIESLWWAMATMLVSALVNLGVSQQLLRAGKDTDSPALAADGHHLRTDIWTSLGVLIGLALVKITGQSWWDSLAALIVSAMILRVGFQLAREALGTLSDATLPAAEEKTLANVLWSHPAVLGFHKLRTRKSGSHRHIDVHVQIADTFTFIEAHRLTEELEDRLRAALPNLHPIIHMEPYDEEQAHQRAEQQMK
jgi:cation diffusion facilitator family transporter